MQVRRLAIVGLALASLGFLLAHLATGTGVLDDLDAINFVMGVRDFDVARHQPHPPGYPIYIALGKIVDAVRIALGGGPGTTGRPHEAIALGLISIVSGAIAVFPLAALFRLIGRDDPIAASAAILTLACPLFWLTASRPLSDMTGLAAALGVQALLATAFLRQQGWRDRDVPPAELAATGRLVVLGALLAGVVVGVRSQTVWVTVPLLGLVIADRVGRGAAGAIVGSLVTFTAGALVWFVPLVVIAGGPRAYWTALTSQAGEDFEGVDMLLTSTQPLRRLAFNLLETFVLPWASVPLAATVLTLAVVGVVALLRRDRRALVLLAGVAGPYAVFHLLVQENVTTRYALPLVPAVAFLAACGLQTLLRRGLPVGVAMVAGVSIAIAHPALVHYTSMPAPIFRAFADMRGAASAVAGPDTPVVAMHRRVFTESRRAREWAGTEALPFRLLPAPRGQEWLELVRYWREGGRGRVWFLADARRIDLALIDPASRHDNGRYAWPFAAAAALVGGARPNEMDWVVIDSPPAWFLGEGWALTPETAGVAGQSGKGPASGGATGWLRRASGPRRLIIGGRNLGAAGDPVVRYTLSLAGRERDRWDVAPNPGFFLRQLDLPAEVAGVGAASLDELVVHAEAADGSGRRVKASIEQFDVRPPDQLQFGFGDGWHEDEYNPQTGLRWHWSSDRAALRVWPGAQNVRVRLAIESPLKTFDDAPIVTLRAGATEVARLQPREAFTIDVRVTAADLEAAGGTLWLETTRVFVPADHVGEGDPRRHDRRRLGLRVFDVRVTPAP